MKSQVTMAFVDVFSSVLGGQVLLKVEITETDVLLKVEGTESTCREETRMTSQGHHSGDGDGFSTSLNDREEIIYHRGNNNFFKQSIVLQAFPQACQPGQYQYPFSFTLPNGLPGSFKYNVSYESARAEVQYFIKAECVVPGSLKCNVRHTHEIMVFQRPAKSPSEMKVEHFQEVKACCCFGQGTARMIAHVEKDAYVPGETANVVLQCENNSEVNFRSIDIFLKHDVNLKADTNIHEHSNITEIGIQACTSFMDQDARVLAFPLPGDLNATVDGRLVSNLYSLIVVLKGSGTVHSVRLKVPLAVFMPPPPHEEFNQPPSFWKPTFVGEPVVIGMPSAPPMPPGPQVMM
eukprot:gene21781-28800_t